MVELTGRIVGVSKDWKTQKYNVTFEIDNQPLADIETLSECKELDIRVKKHREKRSLNANAYLWVLLQKIAEAEDTTKEEVYLFMLQRYSRAFTHVIVKEHAVEKMKSLYRTCIDLGKVKVGNMEGHQLQVYYGSSTFDTKEMSVLLDGVVSECEGMGISTLTPNELQKMKEEWGVNVG
jgi:hypothetical protein